MSNEPIAIVGVSGIFPMAGDVREFWQNVVEGRDCIEDVPANRWNLAEHYDADPAVADKTYARRGGFVPGVRFAPMEFGLSPNQLEVTSALQLLGLVAARDVLADAGAPGSAWYDSKRTGVVLGVTGPVPLTHPLAARLETPVIEAAARSIGLSETDAAAIAEKVVLAYPPWEENSFPGLLQNVISGRIANRFDFGAVNCTVDAACASSLAAVRVAVDELRLGRADLMITGGCDSENSTFGFLCFSKTQAMSRSGRIRPFDADADGTLIGEGFGMLALKRLSDAERDGDRVYATIRGIGSSSDGTDTSIYAPRAEGQQEALHRAYAEAGFSPDTVSLFEAHATGTAKGDATELTALTTVLRESTTERRFAALGSVKSQIGHTKGAAGAASLIKLALGLYHKVLPPTINVERPNPALHPVTSPLYVNTHARPWIADPARPRRRAAASGMGFGGTNFHVVLEESGAGGRTLHRGARAYLWSAPTVSALIEAVREDPADGPIPDGHARVGFVARTPEEVSRLRARALERLTAGPDAVEWAEPLGVFFRREARTAIKVGALFAGQGSQYVEMGLTAVLNNPAVGAAFDQANATFAGASPTLAQAVFPPPSFADETAAHEAQLRATEYAQPAIGALSVGQYRFLTGLGLRCAGFAGHSFGELTALWAAGSLADEDFFTLARARGLAMQPRSGDEDPGTMVAVQTTRENVTEVLADHPDVVVCNHNAPDQVVVGGRGPAVAAAAEALRGRGYPVTELPVSAAFHTALVAHAVDDFGAAVDTVAIEAPEHGPVFANTGGRSYGADLDDNRATLVGALRQPVEFVRAVRELYTHGCDVLVEFGPKSVLTGLAGRILTEQDVVTIATDAGPGGDADRALMTAAVRLAVLGAPVAGINGHLETPRQTPEPQGMTVTLTGAEYVPPARKAAFDAALANGYRVAEPEPRALPAQPVPAAAERPDPAVLEIARQHLDLHREYVASQRGVMDGLAEVIGRHDNGAAAITAFAEHGKALSDAHSQVNEILAGLTAVELPGLPSSNGTDWLDPAPLPPDSPGIGSAVDGVDTGELGRVVGEVIADKTGFPVEMVEPGMDLQADLGVDSIKRVQIVGVVRERMPELTASLSPAELAELRTVGDVIDGLAGAPREAVPERAGFTELPHLTPELTDLPAIDRLVADPFRQNATVLVASDGGPIADRLADILDARGWHVTRVRLGEPARDVQRLDACVIVLDADADADADADYDHAVRALTDAVLLTGRVTRPLLASAADGHRTALVTVTRLDGHLGRTGAASDAAAVLGGCTGLVKTLAQEAPRVFARAIDIAPGIDAGHAAAAVLDELTDSATDLAEVGIDPAGRRTPRWRHRIEPADTSGRFELAESDTVVVTGGARGVTAACVLELARRVHCGFVLLGRSAPDHPEVAATLAAIAEAGGRADYLAVDITDAEATRQALQGRRPAAFVHGAGAIADALLPSKTAAEVATVFGPKLRGFRAVLDALDPAALRHVVVFGSVAGVLGNPGQADYAAANEALGALAARSPGASVIHWGAWEGGMVTPALAETFAARGVRLIPFDLGARAFADRFGALGATLIGDAEPLAGSAPPRQPVSAHARRDLRDLTADAVIADHRIGEHPVLPVAAALGWMAHAVERANPSYVVVSVEGLEVCRGVVLDETAPAELDLVATVRPGEPTVVDVVIRPAGDGRVIPHFRATLRLATAPGSAPRAAPGRRPDGAEPGSSIYDQATLFHGPLLQGIRALWRDGDARAVAECALADTPIAAGAYAGRLHSPVFADIVLQPGVVVATGLLGSACLPLSAGKVEYYAPIPGDTAFLVVIEDARLTEAGVVLTATACDHDGQVFQRFSDVTMVATPDLAAKFAESVRARAVTR